MHFGDRLVDGGLLYLSRCEILTLINICLNMCNIQHLACNSRKCLLPSHQMIITHSYIAQLHIDWAQWSAAVFIQSCLVTLLVSVSMPQLFSLESDKNRFLDFFVSVRIFSTGDNRRQMRFIIVD